MFSIPNNTQGGFCFATSCNYGIGKILNTKTSPTISFSYFYNFQGIFSESIKKITVKKQ